MRHAAALAFGCFALSVAPVGQSRQEPFFPMSVWFDGAAAQAPAPAPAATRREAWLRDLTTIRALGFNSIRTHVDWASAEPARGRYRFDTLDELLGLADEAGLKVILHVATDVSPRWLGQQYPDVGVAASTCDLGHAGVRGDRSAFISAATTRAATSQALYGIDLSSDPRPASCCCPGPVDTRVRHTLVALGLREDLEVKAAASAPRGARPVSSRVDVPAWMASPSSGAGIPDDWWMATAVDHYGTSIRPKPATRAAAWTPVRLGATLDTVRSAARDRGWWAGEVQAGSERSRARADGMVTGADLRLWGWTAIARGARAVSFAGWYPTGPTGHGMVELDGAVTARAQAAGEFAGTVARNPSLFARLRPRDSRIAIFDNRTGYMGGRTDASLARDAMLGIYRVLFDQNIQVDFIHADEVVAGRARTYAVIYLGAPVRLTPEVAGALEVYVYGGGTLIVEAGAGWSGSANAAVPDLGMPALFGARAARLPPGDPAIVATQSGSGKALLIPASPSAAFERSPAAARASGTLLRRLVAEAGVTPDVRIEGAPGLVEARFLESAEAFLLVAINHAETPQHVTLTFPPDIPEAIWQNMETGAAVNFVQGPNGPIYTRSFAPRGVMVLVRGKRLR